MLIKLKKKCIFIKVSWPVSYKHDGSMIYFQEISILKSYCVLQNSFILQSVVLVYFIFANQQLFSFYVHAYMYLLFFFCATWTLWLLYYYGNLNGFRVGYDGGVTCKYNKLFEICMFAKIFALTKIQHYFALF